MCVCVRVLARKAADQHTDRIQRKIGRKKVGQAKPGNLQNERGPLFMCVCIPFSVGERGAAGREEHLKLNEVLRKTHTGSHNKSPASVRQKKAESR